MQWHRIGGLLKQFEKEIALQEYTVADQAGRLVRRQTSVIRTNCMDCLDRTNVVQSEMARHVLTQQFREAGILSATESFTDFANFNSIFKNGMHCFVSNIRSVGRSCRCH
jgi:hypothetical protein